MKPGLKAGDFHEFFIQVQEDMRPKFGDQVIHPLYATAAMLNHMEWAARQQVAPYLEAGEESVGYHIDLKHMAATPVGATVRVRSTVTHVGNTKVVSRVQAWHQQVQIGEGALTQALVQASKLYAVVQDFSPPEKNTPNPPLTVPMAELLSADGQSGFRFEILKWETGQFPCSRYDEWLICQISAFAPHQAPQTYKGPFLLRHEIEEWLEAATRLGKGQSGSFQSDFLEPVLELAWADAGEPGTSDCVVRLSQLNLDLPSGKQDTLTLRLSVTEKALARFALQLRDQLDGFPSKL
ncbi:thioesterase family protein [Vampirovibrio sp.]|uniref:thioesterase family protein n=1 Tax=Vampirovibrio sp. TaxID=2717857 RepID=UPI0035930AE6